MSYIQDTVLINIVYWISAWDNEGLWLQNIYKVAIIIGGLDNITMQHSASVLYILHTC